MDTYSTTTLTYGFNRDDDYGPDATTTITSGDPVFRIMRVYDLYMDEDYDTYCRRRWRETGVFLFWLSGIKRLLAGQWPPPADVFPSNRACVLPLAQAFRRFAPAVWRCRNYHKTVAGKSRRSYDGPGRNCGGLRALFA